MLASGCRLEEAVGLTWDKVYWTAGAIEITNDPLHVAMDGGAWLAVADARGDEALTRRGSAKRG